jgi:membrane fusion protein (multidrug efflux system)
LPGRKFTAVLQAIDPLIDANGRSVGVRACIDNRRLQLRPGMFARVNTVLGQRDDARVIPEEAIVPQAGKQFVIKLLPGPDGLGFVTQRVEVKVGQRMPGKVEIMEGLAVGETVVIAGQQRLQRDGSAVRVLEMAAAPTALGPAAAATPAPKLPTMALAPLSGPDPCRAGMADAASPSAKPARKPA